MKKRTGVFLLLIMLCGCADSGLQIHTMNTGTEAVSAVSSESLTEDMGGNELKDSRNIVVYVCGAVTREGVYELPLGSRAADALEAAGGYSSDAAAGVVNLARLLEDGEQLRFPTAEEAENLSDTGTADGSGEDGRVNINTADRTQLMTLPGIGENRASDIISYRDRNGPFERPEDLMKVSGIKEATWQKLKDRIVVR